MTFRLLACVAFLIARAEAEDGYDTYNQCFKSLAAYENDSPPSKDFFENPWGIVNKTEYLFANKTEGSDVTKRYATHDHACGRYCGFMAETTSQEDLVAKKIIFKNCVIGSDWTGSFTDENGFDHSRPADCDKWIPTDCTDPIEFDGIAAGCKLTKAKFFQKLKRGEGKGGKVMMLPSLYWMLEYESMDYMLCSSVEGQMKPRCDWGYNSYDKLRKKSTCDPTSLQSCCGSGSGFEGELATQPQAMANESNGVAAMVVVAVAAVAGIVGVVGMALKKGSITKPMTTTDV